MSTEYVNALRRQFQRICASIRAKNGQDAGYNSALWKQNDLKNPPSMSAAQIEGLFKANNAFERYAEFLCMCYTAMEMKKLKMAWKFGFQLLRLTIKILDGYTQTNWYLPLVYSGLELTQNVALKHDAQFRDGDAVNTTMTDMLTLTRTIRRNQGKSDTDAQSQKLAAVFVINQLLKLSFLTEQLSYCKTAMITADAYVSELHLFPKSHVVEFKFYRGRYNMFEENYKEAKADLEYALNVCHKNATNSKLKILEILIPINLLFGVFPKPQLLKKYSLPHLSGVIDACKAGDIGSFQKQMELHQQKYIESGIFLLITMIEPLCYRKVIQKLYLLMKKRHEAQEVKLKPHILPLPEISLAMKLQGADISNAELECILANLIYKNVIKGYIAHNKALVLSKEAGFPTLADMKRNI